MPLLTKQTKRCPAADCRHLLIQPDTKSVRFKIKMAASNYVPVIEVGRRRRRVDALSTRQTMLGTVEEVEGKRKERRRTRREEVDENMGEGMGDGAVVRLPRSHRAMSLRPCPSPRDAGERPTHGSFPTDHRQRSLPHQYTFQLAFTNTTLDTVQIRLTPLNKVLTHVPTPHFVVAPPTDAWAYDDEDDAHSGLLGAPEDATEAGASDDGSVMTRGTSAMGTLPKRSRMSLLPGAGSGTPGMRERRKKEADVEKRGNVSRVLVEVEVPPEAKGKVEVSVLSLRHARRRRECCRAGGMRAAKGVRRSP